jgi:membrane protein required for colicin V production
MDFTVVDGVVAVLIILSAILAYSRGLVRELMAIVGWIGAGFLAYIFAEQAQPLVKEIPVVGEFIRNSCELSLLGGALVVFVIGLVVAALFTPLLSSVIQRSALGGIDQALGFLFGVLRGVVLVAVAFVIFDRAVASNTVPMIDNSRTAKVIASVQGDIDAAVPSNIPTWLNDLAGDFTKVCAAPAEPAPAEPAPAPANP